MFPPAIPGVTKPECREGVQVSGFRSAVVRSNTDENIFCIRFGVFDEYIEVTVLIEDACIKQFIFWRTLAALTICLHQIRIWERALWIFINHLHITMRRRGTKVKIIFFHILPMIPL